MAAAQAGEGGSMEMHPAPPALARALQRNRQGLNERGRGGEGRGREEREKQVEQ